jgi:hypothetical protein
LATLPALRSEVLRVLGRNDLAQLGCVVRHFNFGHDHHLFLHLPWIWLLTVAGNVDSRTRRYNFGVLTFAVGVSLLRFLACDFFEAIDVALEIGLAVVGGVGWHMVLGLLLGIVSRWIIFHISINNSI